MTFKSLQHIFKVTFQYAETLRDSTGIICTTYSLETHSWVVIIPVGRNYFKYPVQISCETY